MAVILVLCTFAVFIAIDAILSRKRAPQTETATAKPSEAPDVSQEVIDGFHVPAELRYHPGHSWAYRERKNVIRVGIDEFASKLAGKIDKIELPKPGHWIRQGQRAWALFRGEEKAEMLSPVEGEVVEVNPELIHNPALIHQDPYGKGWLFTVFAPDEESVLRNLLPAEVVGGWMRETVSRLYAKQPALAGAVAADGGRPADDLAAAIPGASWKELTAEFFLTR